jgi:hypothetical protein
MWMRISDTLMTPYQRAFVEQKLVEWTDRSGDHWLWNRSLKTAGYGVIGIPQDVVAGVGSRKILAHRASYEIYVGPIPKGMTIDHLCRVRACVKPEHLEPVSMKENLLRGEGWAGKHARQTHCKRGHSLTPENLDMVRFRKTGHRICRTCVLEHHAERYRTDPEFRAKKIAVTRAWTKAHQKV